jgi:hypothetical protein
MNADYTMTISRRPRTTRVSALRRTALLRPATPRPTGNFHRDAPSRRYRLPPTRAARSPRSRGVFFAPGKRAISVAVIAAALAVVGAMLGTAKFVDSATFNANAGPQLFASASLAPPPIAALRR